MKTLTFNQLTNPSTADRDWNETTSRVLWDNPRPWPYLFRTLLVLFSLLTLGVGQMWAGPTFSGGYAYFYNKGGWSDSYKQLCIGKSSYTSTYTMTAITNTKLWYASLPTSGWGDATYMAVIGNSSSWGSGSWGPSNLSNANHRTGTVDLGNWGFSSGNVNMLTPANGNNDATLSLSYVGNAYSSLNKTITIKAKTAVNSSTYSDDNTPAKLTASSKAFSSYTSCGTGKSATLNAGSASTTISCGYTATTTLTASDADGYDFIGWYDSSGNQVTTNKTLTIYPTDATTYYAYYKTYEVKVATITPTVGGSATPTTWTKMSPTNGGSITATPNTGYSFTGWSILSGGGGYFGATGTATTSSTANTVFRPTKSSQLKATFTANTYTITLDGNGGTSGSATVQYNASSLSSITHASRAGYTLNGYYTASSGGSKVINADGSLNNVAGWVSGSYWNKASNGTLYAQWTENIVNYAVTYGVHSSGHGTLAATNTATSATISSGSEVLSGTGVTFTASPATGYEVDGWFSNSACTTPIPNAGTSNTYSTTISAATTVYVKFKEKTWSVAFAAGTGGSVTTPNSTPKTVGQVTGISIEATPATGYTFNTWTITSGSGSFTSAATTNSNTFKPTAASTITASFNETKSTITVTTATSSQGTLKFGSTAQSWGATASVGVTTTQNITATAATGFTFVRWELSGAATSTSTLTNNTITLKADGSGSTGTATAIFEEDLSTPFIVTGGNKIVTTGTTWRTTADDYNKMLKKTGHSAEKVAYFYVDVTATNTGSSNSNYQFKIYKTTATTNYYGLTASGQYYCMRDQDDGVQRNLSTSGANIELRADVVGRYEIKVDYTTSTYKITVTFPTSYVVTYGVSPSGAANAVTTSPSITSGDIVLSGTSITFTHQVAKTGFVWKGWYNNTAGTGDALGTGNTYTTTVTAATQVYAVYTENEYNVTVSAGAGGSVSPNGTVAIKQVTGTSLTATPNTGYYFTNWTKVGSAITLSSATDNPVTAKATSGGGSITANFASQWAWASDKNGWSTSANVLDNYTITSGKTYGYVEVTLEANTQYSFKFVDVKNGTWYGPTTNTEITYANKGTAQTMSNTAGGGANQTIMTGAPGTYRFTWNITDKKVTVTYPTGYTVTFSVSTLKGSSSGASAAPTATYNSGANSVSSGDYVPAGTSVTFTAEAAKSGYTFNGWYTAASGGTQKSSELSYSETVSSNITRYARYTQNTHNVTLTNANSSQGIVNTTSPVTVGEAEAVQIQATPNSGYMFKGWIKTAGAGTVTYHVGAGADQIEDAGGNAKATTYITVTGGNVTLQATWDDDRWSGYYVHYGNDGTNADGGPDASQARAWTDGNLYKKADEMSGTVSYFTYTASAADVGKVIEFKIVKYSPDTWYGYYSASGGKITASISNKVLNTSYGNGRMVMPTPGDYVFKWDSNGNKLSITYPAGNYVRGQFDSWGWINELSGSGPWTATINLPADQLYATAASGNTGFKYVISGQHYGKNGTISATSNSLSSCTTSGQNMGLATTIGGDYLFTVAAGKTQITVTYPSIPAMTGTLGLTVTGARGGSGTELNPYSVYEGDEITLSKTHTSAPANDSHFKYTYYEGAKNASTATTELATRPSTADNTSYTFTVNQDIGKYPLKVAAYYEYGPEGYKVRGTAQESGIVYFRVHLAPGVELTADKVSITDGQSVTLTATPNHLEVHGINVKYEFFNGNSTADIDRISQTTKTVTADDAPTATQVVTPDCSGDANSWTYTVRMTYLGITKTATVTVYRKWDIYVNDVCGWGTLKLYNWDASGGYPVAFPGTAQPLVDGSTHWYKVTLDTRYSNFKLSKQSGTESNNHVADHATYLPGTYWYLNNCKTLTEVTISTPTVTISATVTNATQINLTGNITDFGNDGSKASEMKEVYFNVNGAKEAAGITASTTNGEFTKALNNPTASASPNNTLQAAATNIGYTGTSSTLRFTNITLDKQSGTGGTSAVVAVNGVAMAAGATPPTRTGYVFGGYYSEPDGAGTRYFTKTMASAHDWDQTAATATLYAKWSESVPYTVYFYNKDNWATPTAHLWVNGGESETAYPGTAMTVHQGKVYKHDYDFGEEFDRIQFNSGSDANKTADMPIGGNLGDLVTTNQLFYNPENGGTWTQYIMVAAWPTPTSSTKIKAVVGEKVTVEPVFAWAEGIDLSDISITSSRTTGSSSINAVIAGTKILVSGTAAGSATFSITYSYGGFSINKTLYVEIVNGLTIQARIAKTDNHWVYNDIVRMHYWGTGIGNSDLTMSWLKSDATYNYYQASVPTGTDGEANFVFYYDYMNDTGTTKWRQTNNIEHVTTEKCYTISFSGNESAHSNCTTSGTGLCVTSWQIQIVMGSGDIFNSNIAESSSDIVSFFAPSNANEAHTYRQGVVTLEHNGSTVHTYPANTFSASGVYTAKINTDNYSLTDLALYTGDYYIRTDPSAGGWDNYLTEPDNKMTYFNRNTNFPNETFSYYWVDNIAKTSGGSGTVNIKAVVANDYNPMLTVFTQDDNITREEHGINLRFGYEPTTNDIVRGIIRGATNSDFLNLLGETGNVYKTQACAAAYVMDEDYYDAYKDSCKMQDKSNWVYDIFVFAKIDDSHTTADIYLKSNYNGIHYLLGMVKDGFGRDTNEPISFPIIRNDTRTTNGVYRLAIIYDFKTNRLLGAWTPTDLVIDCSDDRNTDANIMFIRHENKDVAQIDFITEECGSTSKITGLQQAILALEVDNDKNASLGNRELHYFVTMPFDCRVGDIFGIPGFMEYWGVQRYNGELRAQIGWFPSTPTFWEWLDENDIMHAGEGYLVSIDKKALQTHNVWKEGIIYQTQDTVKEGGVPVKTHDDLSDSVVWVTHTDGSLLTLYFLSTTTGFTIEPASGSSMTISYPNQLCGITSGHRDHQDSNWKCLGTPGYRNVDISAYSATSGVPYYIDDETEEEYAPPKFLYIFNEQTTSAAYAKGTYTVVDGTDFTYHSFNSYMVQYAGTINWSHYSKGAPAGTPSPIAPRRMPTSAEKQKTKMQLDLLSEENESLDRTFILLREDATNGFDQNYDLNKMVERNANQIYSFAEYDIPFAANALPLETDTVPLVVNIVNAGEYTFSMLKERHYGMTPILYDMFESQQIDLTATDYTVNLTKGKYTDRFYVLFAPVHPIATDIEITEDGTHHVLSNEAIYDVLGRRVDTVYPQHLYIVNGEKRIMR